MDIYPLQIDRQHALKSYALVKDTLRAADRSFLAADVDDELFSLPLSDSLSRLSYLFSLAGHIKDVRLDELCMVQLHPNTAGLTRPDKDSFFHPLDMSHYLLTAKVIDYLGISKEPTLVASRQLAAVDMLVGSPALRNTTAYDGGLDSFLEKESRSVLFLPHAHDAEMDLQLSKQALDQVLMRQRRPLIFTDLMPPEEHRYDGLIKELPGMHLHTYDVNDLWRRYSALAPAQELAMSLGGAKSSTDPYLDALLFFNKIPAVEGVAVLYDFLGGGKRVTVAWERRE